MKVFVISDMEGVAGIVKWQQVTGGHDMYEEGRRLTRARSTPLSAAQGRRRDGDRRHGLPRCRRRMDVQLADARGARSRLRVRGSERVDGVRRVPRAGVDAALFVGMHAMAGTRDGVLAHTVSGSSWWRCTSTASKWVRTGIYAALCGNWGCPVLLVTGDEASCREGGRSRGRSDDLAVKKGLGRFSARQFPAVRARELIEAGAKWALADLRAVARNIRISVRDHGRLQHLCACREIPLPGGLRSPSRGRSCAAPITGGPPGGSSSSNGRLTRSLRPSEYGERAARAPCLVSRSVCRPRLRGWPRRGAASSPLPQLPRHGRTRCSSAWPTLPAALPPSARRPSASGTSTWRAGRTPARAGRRGTRTAPS